MTNSGAMKAKIVRVKIERGPRLFFATSPDLEGLLVARRKLEALDHAIPKAVAALYSADGVEVIVTKADDQDSESTPWVAVPVDVARAALASNN